MQAGLEGCTELLSCSKLAKVPAGHTGQGLVAGGHSLNILAVLHCHAWCMVVPEALLLHATTLI
jgi:hypothetical protein